MDKKSDLFVAIVAGDAAKAADLTKNYLGQGVDPQAILTEHMIPALGDVGDRFESGELFIPELLISARAMKAGLALIRPLLAQSPSASQQGRVVIGTVQGDLHDIGKNIVSAMLEGGGFEVIDLGIGVSPEKFTEAIRDNQAAILAMSALLTTTMSSMRATIEALRNAGLREQVKVMVGGAPVTQTFADEIGADGFSNNANGALALARGWIQAKANASSAA